MVCGPSHDSGPALSVVIPVYNGAAFLPACLASLAAQTRHDFEIVLVDDGSTDGSAAIAQAFARQDGAPPLRLIRQDNSGVSAARNRGIAEARAPLIGFLDSDDTWEPQKVARQLAVMEREPGVVLSYTGFGIIGQSGQDLLERSLPPGGLVGVGQLMPRNFIHTSTVIVRRSALQAVGGFDPSLRAFEDFELWLRLAERDDPCLFGLSEVLCQYRRHETQTTSNWQAMAEGWRAVAARLEQRHPDLWPALRGQAMAHNLEYCASLAYNAGEIADMRRLMQQALRAGALHVLQRRDGIIMSGIMLCSYLPRPVQLGIGRGFVSLRRCKRFVENRLAVRP